MNKEEWRTEILTFIAHYGGATFADLMRKFGDDAKGDYTLFVPKCRNLILWSNMSEEMAVVIKEMHAERLIKFDPDSVYLYILDGMILPYPIVYKIGDYPEYRWCPMMIYTTWRVMRKKNGGIHVYEGDSGDTDTI